MESKISFFLSFFLYLLILFWFFGYNVKNTEQLEDL